MHRDNGEILGELTDPGRYLELGLLCKGSAMPLVEIQEIRLVETLSGDHTTGFLQHHVFGGDGVVYKVNCGEVILYLTTPDLNPLFNMKKARQIREKVADNDLVFQDMVVASQLEQIAGHREAGAVAINLSELARRGLIERVGNEFGKIELWYNDLKEGRGYLTLRYGEGFAKMVEHTHGFGFYGPYSMADMQRKIGKYSTRVWILHPDFVSSVLASRSWNTMIYSMASTDMQRGDFQVFLGYRNLQKPLQMAVLSGEQQSV